MQLFQYLASGSQNDESEVDIRKISIFLLEDTLPGLLNSDSEDGIDYTVLEKELARRDRPFDAISDFEIDIEPEMRRIDALVLEIIASIDKHLSLTRSCTTNTLTFAELWKINRAHALSEILRAVGHGTSFWWHHEYEDFGLEDMPEIDDFDSPYNETQSIRDKVIAYIQQQLA